ncbi:MAG: UbiA family prenyltransferase [Patescibacteria group bacterium]
MISRERFSERRFPGYVTWLGIFYAYALSGSLLASLAYPRADGRLADPTRLLVLWPLYALIAVALVAWVLRRSLGVSLKATLYALQSRLWLLWLPWALDLVIRAIGLPVERVTVNAGQLGLGMLTAGFYPWPLASIGTLVTFLVVIWMVYKTVFAVTTQQKQAIYAAGAMYLGTMAILALPSILGWFGLSEVMSIFSAGSLAVRRGLISLGSDGYWWRNVYERFPFALGGEAEMSVALFLGALAFVALALKAGGLVVRDLLRDRRQALVLIRQSGAPLSVALVFFGVALASLQKTFPVALNAAFVLSWVVFVIVLLAIFVAASFQNDGQGIVADEQNAPEKPLITGMMALASLKEAQSLLLIVGLVGAWLLGWPVFVCIALYYLLRTVYDLPAFATRQSWLASAVMLGAADLSLIVAGWFFQGQHANIVRFPLGLAIGLFLGLAGLSSLKDLRDVKGDQMAGWQTVPLRFVDKGPERVLALVAVMGCLLPALFSGWTRWLLLAAPLAGALAFFIFAKPYSDRPVRTLTWLFFALSGLLLLSGWLQGVYVS